MKNIYTRVRFITLSLFLLFSLNSFSQVAIYSFSQANGTYSPITGGTVLGTPTTDDTSFPNLPIGFTFSYNNVNYTSFSVNSNGFIALGTTIASSYASLSTGTTNNVIAALNYDLQGSATVGNLQYITTGTAPNRVLTVQWSNFASFSSTTNNTENFNFQIQLFETTNVIQVQYGSFIKNATTRNAQVGLRGASNADFNNRTSSTNWSTTTSGTANNNTVTLNSTTTPASGLTFIWTPPSGCTGSPTAGSTVATPATACSGVSFSLTLSGSVAASGLTYQWQSSTDGVTYSNITGATAVNYSANQTAATYYQAVLTCTSSGLSSTSTPVFVTMNSPTNCYCTSAATNTGDEEILNVTLSSLNNSSTCATTGGPGSILNRYSNYSSTVAAPSVMQGLTYPFSVQIGTCGGNFNSGTRIFIDYNQDGDFVDAGETVFTTAASQNGPHTVSGNITIPIGATSGNTRMRIVNVETGTPTSITSCGTYGYGETEDYSIEILAASVCSAPPAAGSTVANPSTACSSVTINLSLSGASTGSGLTYQWESSTDNVTFVPITGATSSTYSTTQSATTYYHALVTCSGVTDTSSSVLVTTSPATQCYCTSTSTSSADEDIFNVTVGSLNNASTCTTTGGPGSTLNRYSNFTAVAAPQLMQGIAYPFSVQIGTCGGNFNNASKIFIDYNQDGDFVDAGETVYTAAAAFNGPHTESGSITIPFTAVPGNTRMRVVNVETTTPNTISSCGTYTYGETEDYTVQIVPATPCTAPPTAGATMANDSTVCSSVTINLSLSGSSTGSGLTYQWESSPNNITWTAITGANSPTYSTTQSSNTYYHALVTCSGSTDTSNSLLVTTNPATQCYCTPVYTSACSSNDFINNFSTSNGVTNITNNATGCNGQSGNYIYYSSMTASEVMGQSFNLSMQSGSAFGQGFKVWIDWNQDGDFFDAGEMVYSSGSSATTVFNGTVNVPFTAVAGTTRMRVRAQYNAVPADPCASAAFGETEDYNFTVILPPPVDMGVTAVAAPSSTGCYDATETVRYTITNFNSTTIDFSISPVTIKGFASGPNPVTFTPLTINSGTLAAGASLDTAISTTYNMTAFGTYTFTGYTVVPNDINNSNDTLTPFVIIISPSVASVTPSTICYGETATLNLSNYSNGTIQWQSSSDGVTWNNEPGAGSTTDNFIVTGVDTIAFRALVCGLHPSNEVTLNVKPLPVVSLGGDTTRCGGYVVLDAANAGSTYSWSNGGTSQTDTVSTSGTYIAYVTSPLGCVNSDTINVTINPIPVIDLRNDTTVCNGVVVTVDAHNAGSSFVWSTNETTQTINVVTAGMYTVVVTSPQGCINSDTFNLMVNPLPVVSIGADTSFCFGDTLVLDPGAGFTSYLWNNNSSDQTMTVDSANTYYVTVSNIYGCYQTDSIHIIVNPLPVTFAGVDQTICFGQGAQLNASGGGSYLWSNGAVTPSVFVNPPVGSNLFYVTSTNNFQCSTTDSVIVFVNPLPLVSAGSDQSFCGSVSQVQLIATGALSYIWSNGASNDTILVTPANSTIFSVTGTDVNGCVASDSVSVIINPNPIVNAGNDQGICNGNSAILTATGANTYTWSTGGTTATIVVNPTQTTTYTVTGTSSAGCSITDNVVVFVNSLPAVSISQVAPVCLGSSVTLVATGANSYIWSNGATGSSISVTPAGSGIYSVVGTSNGCSSSDTTTIIVNYPPIASFTSTVNGATFNFINQSAGATSYVWSFGDGSGSTNANPSHTYTTNGAYTVILAASNNCGTDSVTMTVPVGTIGIEENDRNNDLTVYPNPTNGEFTLELFSSSQSTADVVLKSIEGKVVKLDKNLSINGKVKLTYNITGYAKGVYMLQVISSQGITTKRIVLN